MLLKGGEVRIGGYPDDSRCGGFSVRVIENLFPSP